MSQLTYGIERLCGDQNHVLSGKRVGLLMNQASVTRDLVYSCHALHDAIGDQLRCLFSPQHGLWGEQQANMVESSNAVYAPLGIPVYSLYGETRWPTESMLSDIDCLIVDLQDVGTRVYTFIWTMSYCLEACARLAIEMVIADRPNPLGSRIVEGQEIKPGYESFVGRFPIPMRHGMTMGEMAKWLNDEYNLGAQLTVVDVLGWDAEPTCSITNRGIQCDRTWIPPSPNLPRWESIFLYPGQVLLEGTNLSEGRGTTRPFEIVGAPFVDPDRLYKRLQSHNFPGLKLLPIRFEPTFDKWAGESCGGISFHVTDSNLVRSYEATVRILHEIFAMWPDQCEFLPPPYEYETEKWPIDILSGSSELRESILSSR